MTDDLGRFKMFDSFTVHEIVCLWHEQDPDTLERETLEHGWMLGQPREPYEGYPNWYKQKYQAIQSATRYSNINRDWLRDWFSSKGVYPCFLFSDGDKEGLKVFQAMENLKASELTVRLLWKEGQPLPDRLEVSAREKRRTVPFNKIDLASDSGKLKREGQMLVALARKTTPKNIKSPEQAMTKLRKIFRDIGIMDADPFLPKKAGWEPRFKLLDAQEQADKRAADRAIHVPLDDRLQYDQEDDAAKEWLREK